MVGIQFLKYFSIFMVVGAMFKWYRPAIFYIGHFEPI